MIERKEFVKLGVPHNGVIQVAGSAIGMFWDIDVANMGCAAESDSD